jgi:oligopeptide transport system substrate-binding protein
MLKKALLFLCLFFTLACSKKSKERADLRLNLCSDIPTLDPRQGGDELSNLVNFLLYDGLFRINKDNVPEHALCEKYFVSTDHKTYIFTLAKTKWANGSGVTAYDFVNSWYSSLNPNNPGPNVDQFYIIKNAKEYSLGQAKQEDVGIWALDDHTIKVELTHPAPYFLDLIATTPYYSIHSSIISDPCAFKNLENNLFTNGPFKLVSWVPNDHMILEKNPMYWDKKHVHLNKVHFSMVADIHSELQMFEHNEIDWCGAPISEGIPSDAIEDLKRKGLLQDSHSYKVSWVMFNTQTSPFNNEKIRQAFALAIDRHLLVKYITHLEENALASAPFPPVFSCASGYFKDADIQKAQLLFEEGLKETGFTRNGFEEIKIMYYTGKGSEKLAQVLQQQWKRALNVQLQLEHFEFGVYIDHLTTKNYTVGLVNFFSTYSDPQFFFDIFKSKDNSTNLTGWEDKKYAALIDAANLSQQCNMRTLFLQKAEKILAEQMPVAPLYYKGATYVANPKLKGYFFTKCGNLDLKSAYLEQ